MDQWDALRQHELRQRQQRIAREQGVIEEQLRKEQEFLHQQSLREQSRIQAEQRLAEEKQIAKQQAEEKQSLAEDARRDLLLQSSEELRIANQRSREMQQVASQKIQEEVKAKVWIGMDGKEFRSPLEQAFWDEWLADNERATAIPLVPQYQIGRYYVDFAHVASKTAIELDGRSWHTGRYAFTHDRVRQRTLEKQGWYFIRFSGVEISSDVAERVIETYEIIRGR